jgi:hypothetical protein
MRWRGDVSVTRRDADRMTNKYYHADIEIGQASFDVSTIIFAAVVDWSDRLSMEQCYFFKPTDGKRKRLTGFSGSDRPVTNPDRPASLSL